FVCGSIRAEIVLVFPMIAASRVCVTDVMQMWRSLCSIEQAGGLQTSFSACGGGPRESRRSREAGSRARQGGSRLDLCEVGGIAFEQALALVIDHRRVQRSVA